ARLGGRGRRGRTPRAPVAPGSRELVGPDPPEALPSRPVATLRLIPAEEFARVSVREGDRDGTLATLADMCRANALVAVKRAGSGHLGSSFSSLDLVVHLLWEELN